MKIALKSENSIEIEIDGGKKFVVSDRGDEDLRIVRAAVMGGCVRIAGANPPLDEERLGTYVIAILR